MLVSFLHYESISEACNDIYRETIQSLERHERAKRLFKLMPNRLELSDLDLSNPNASLQQSRWSPELLKRLKNAGILHDVWVGIL